MSNDIHSSPESWILHATMLRAPEFNEGPFTECLARFSITGRLFFRYPDGTIQVGMGPPNAEPEQQLWTLLTSGWNQWSGRLGERDASLPCNGWRHIATFAARRYTLAYGCDYQQQLGEQRLLFYPGPYNVPTELEGRLHQLQTVVVFRRKPARQAMSAFASALRQWHNSVRQAGMAGDGPIRSISQHVEWRGRAALFAIDASASGQDTLNWLIVSLVHFGTEHLIEAIHFANPEPERLFPWMRSHEPIRVGIPAEVPVGVAPVARAQASTPHPSSISPHPLISSQRFPVVLSPHYQWEDLLVSVRLGNPVGLRQRERIAHLLRSWLTLAETGAFGGRGLHSFEEPIFREGGEVACVRADMGDCDEVRSLEILVRALEGLDRQGENIEQLVLG